MTPTESVPYTDNTRRGRKSRDPLSLEGAIIWAAVAHDGQRRANGTPYILHPLRVMLAVSSNAQRAAVLHDVLEDTDQGLPGALDEVSAEAVVALTRDSGDPYESYIDDIASHPGPAGEIAREVKVADLRDNLMSDPGNMKLARLIRLKDRYTAALEVLGNAEPTPTRQCKFCGSAFGYGECCPDCWSLCTCPWEHGMGPNLKCPIHGLLEFRIPLYRGTH